MIALKKTDLIGCRFRAAVAPFSAPTRLFCPQFVSAHLVVRAPRVIVTTFFPLTLAGAFVTYARALIASSSKRERRNTASKCRPSRTVSVDRVAIPPEAEMTRWDIR
jgi:hypothetical protein